MNELTVSNGAVPDILREVEQMAKDRKELIRRTVAPDSTPQELDLFIYDCLRRRTHPLDKMIHFTKRGGRYTPITGIDYMRSLAGETDAHAGTDDAVFVAGEPFPVSATITVYRITQGQRYGYAATARWSEYYPGDGQLGFMWRKMPHVMLAKVAEALALRKAFPRQLGGLYAREEMAQAGVSDADVVEGAPSTPARRRGKGEPPALSPEQRAADVAAMHSGTSQVGPTGKIVTPAVADLSGKLNAVLDEDQDPADAVNDALAETWEPPAEPAPAKPRGPNYWRTRVHAYMGELGFRMDDAGKIERRRAYSLALNRAIVTDAQSSAIDEDGWRTIGKYLKQRNTPPDGEAAA